MSSRAGNPMHFSQFLLRVQSLKLYRDLLRTANKIPDKDHRAEMKKWIREDFESNRHHENQEVIKYHISRGRIAAKQLKSSLQLAECKL